MVFRRCACTVCTPAYGTDAWEDNLVSIQRHLGLWQMRKCNATCGFASNGASEDRGGLLRSVQAGQKSSRQSSEASGSSSDAHVRVRTCQRCCLKNLGQIQVRPASTGALEG